MKSKGLPKKGFEQKELVVKLKYQRQFPGMMLS